MYQSPDDIDLYIGVLGEEPMDGAAGPTIACLMGNICICLFFGKTIVSIIFFNWLKMILFNSGEQLNNLRTGDRFFFTHTKGKVTLKIIIQSTLKVQECVKQLAFMLVVTY